MCLVIRETTDFQVEICCKAGQLLYVISCCRVAYGYLRLCPPSYLCVYTMLPSGAIFFSGAAYTDIPSAIFVKQIGIYA